MKDNHEEKGAVEHYGILDEGYDFIVEDQGLTLEQIVEELRGSEINLVEQIEAKLRENELILKKIKEKLKSNGHDLERFKKRVQNL